jgi:transcriptional regulator with XRE-family HTH domain
MKNSRITEMRAKNNLNQQGLAELAGVSLHTVFRAEKGNNVQTESIKALAAALDTSVAYLLGETDDPSPPTDIRKANGGADLAPQEHAPPASPEVKSNLRPVKAGEMIRVRILGKNYKMPYGIGIDWRSGAIEFESSMLMHAPDLVGRYSDDDLIGMYADGDSMETHISDDDFVIFAWREKAVSYAGILMVVSYNNRIMIRGVIENNKKAITLKAHNKDYGDVVVTQDDDFEILGTVIRVFATKKPMPVL